MTTLMIYAGPVAEDAAVTRTGGLPLAPPAAEWPECADCSGAMQFLAQVRLDDLPAPAAAAAAATAPSAPVTAPDTPPAPPEGDARGVLAVFMCENNPGVCETWAPTSGANRAVLHGCGELTTLPAPEKGRSTRLPETCGVQYVPVDGADYDTARVGWKAEHAERPRDVLGQLGGEPGWVQGEETPDCPSCGLPMPLAAQFEQGRDHRTEMNFGGGCGYLFACEPCREGIFLWQC